MSFAKGLKKTIFFQHVSAAAGENVFAGVTPETASKAELISLTHPVANGFDSHLSSIMCVKRRGCEVWAHGRFCAIYFNVCEAPTLSKKFHFSFRNLGSHWPHLKFLCTTAKNPQFF